MLLAHAAVLWTKLSNFRSLGRHRRARRCIARVLIFIKLRITKWRVIMYTHMCVYMCVYTHVYMYMCTCIRIGVRVRISVRDGVGDGVRVGVRINFISIHTGLLQDYYTHVYTCACVCM